MTLANELPPGKETRGIMCGILIQYQAPDPRQSLASKALCTEGPLRLEDLKQQASRTLGPHSRGTGMFRI